MMIEQLVPRRWVYMADESTSIYHCLSNSRMISQRKQRNDLRSERSRSVRERGRPEEHWKHRKVGETEQGILLHPPHFTKQFESDSLFNTRLLKAAGLRRKHVNSVSSLEPLAKPLFLTGAPSRSENLGEEPLPCHNIQHMLKHCCHVEETHFKMSRIIYFKKRMTYMSLHHKVKKGGKWTFLRNWQKTAPQCGSALLRLLYNCCTAGPKILVYILNVGDLFFVLWTQTGK